MSKLTPDDNRFAELVGGFFHQLLKAGGVSMMPTTSHERIREVGEQFARSIEAAAERKSVLVIRKLQTAVKDAFVRMEVTLDEQVDVTKAWVARVRALEDRIDALEAAARTDKTEDSPELVRDFE
jgi:BMFP domain-containing protein YqiC